MTTQSKCGIALCGDAILGVFTPNVYITLGGSVLGSGAVRIASLRVTLNRNETPDSAEFIVNRDAGVTVTAGQTVYVALGDPTNYLFGGQVAQVRHVRKHVNDLPDFDVTCTDWSRLFNSRLVTGNFSGQSATTIATTIVETYAPSFTTQGIDQGLATIAEFICIDEPPLSALSRLATLLGGGCYLSPERRVHLWGAAGPTSYYAPSPPATLINSLHTLKEFTPEYDYSQVRTRVIVEGRSAKTVVDIPAGAYVNFPTYGIPVDHDNQWAFNPSYDAEANHARLGSLLVRYHNIQNVLGPPNVITAADANPGDTTVSIVSGSGTGVSGIAPYWFYADARGANYFVGDSYVPGGGGTDTLAGIPASGYGSISAFIPAGAPIYQTGRLVVDGSGANTTDIRVGSELLVRAQADHTSAQAAIAAIEGGDGIREHKVSDSELTYAGCLARAQTELAIFGAALTSASWVTHDLQALPGAQQVINLSSPDALSATLTIDSVTIDWSGVDLTPLASATNTCDSNLWPRRICQGSTVKLATILDAIKG